MKIIIASVSFTKEDFDLVHHHQLPVKKKWRGKNFLNTECTLGCILGGWISLCWSRKKIETFLRRTLKLCIRLDPQYNASRHEGAMPHQEFCCLRLFLVVVYKLVWNKDHRVISHECGDIA